MDEYGGNEISDVSRGWALCLLILPITIFVLIWISMAIPFYSWTFLFYGALIIFVVILAIIGIPILVDSEYRERVIRRIRREEPPPEILFDPDATNWNDPGTIQVWPTIRSSEGTPVSSRSHLHFSEPPLRSLPTIQEKLPELEEAINELDSQVEAYSITLETREPDYEQLMIEKKAANQLLTSLQNHRGNNRVAPEFYRRKRRRLLRTIEQIDTALEKSPKRKQVEAPL